VLQSAVNGLQNHPNPNVTRKCSTFCATNDGKVRSHTHTHTQSLTRTYMRAHTLAHAYKIKICKYTRKRHETNIKVRLTWRVPPFGGQWQNHYWGLKSV